MADMIASARAMTTVADNQYVAIGMPKGGLTPATITAMVGFQRGGGEAIDLSSNVKLAMAELQTVADSGDYPANVQAASALSTLTTVQAKLFNKNDCGGFGAIVSQAQSHCDDSKNLMSATSFLKDSNYSDFGSGINDLSSMGDRGMTNVFGDLPGAGAAINSGGKLWNGVDVKNLGSPGGLVEAFQNNKLANATGLNQKLSEAGVDLNNLGDPAYKDKISGVLSNINDPAALDASAEQFGQANPFAGMPAYTGTDSSIYKSPSFLTGETAPAPVATTTTSTSSFGAPAVTTRSFSTTTGTSTTGTSFGATTAPAVTTGGIQSLKDLGDYTKTADPSTTSGLETDLAGVGLKLSDMGGGKMIDATQGLAFFGSIKKVETPLTNAAHPTLNSLMIDSDTTSAIESMIGLPSGSTAIPNMRDILGPVAGNPEIDALAGGYSADKVTALNTSLTKTNGFIASAQLQASTGTPTQTLGKNMGFATNLHKYGKDMSEGGVGTMLRNMANTATKYGESVAASLAEGENNNLLALNGIGPLQTNPFEGTPSYTGTDGSLYTNPQVKMMGGS